MSLLRPTHFKRVMFFVALDVFISIISLFIAYQLRFNIDGIDPDFYNGFLLALVILIPVKIVSFSFHKVYLVAWRFFGLHEAKRIVYAHMDSYVVFIAVYYLFSEYFNPFPRSVIIIDFFLSVFFIGLLRISKRFFIEGTHRHGVKRHTVLIGANNRAQNVVKSYFNGEHDYFPECIIDDDPKMVGTYLSDIQVSSLEDMASLLKSRHIDSAIITKDMESEKLDVLFERLKECGVKEIKLSKAIEEKDAKLKDISIEDLLARKPKDLDTSAIGEFIQHKRVLITGAGGSIGSEIARQCAVFGASELILIDNSEFNLYRIGEELRKNNIREIMVSVSDRDRLAAVFEKYQPEIVIHAAAYKHVPLCEQNKESAVINNIRGTKNVIDLAIKNGVSRVVIVSTDKAVRPTNVMGATKRVAELYAQNVASDDTEIVSVRFGNVLGSSGSVVPKFKEQILSGGPVTVTDPEVKRYFMLIPEACQLVLQAGAIAQGGEIFILDMGEPVKIVDLAEKMIMLYDKKGEVKIEFTGLRPGEKLYEELLIDESERKTQYESIHVGKPTQYPISELETDIKTLLVAGDKVKALKNIVPEFNHQPNQ